MSREIFLEQVNEALMVGPTESLAWDSHFREHLNWSSLASLMLISMFYSEYGVRIDANNFKDCRTPEDLYQFVAQELEQQCTT